MLNNSCEFHVVKEAFGINWCTMQHLINFLIGKPVKKMHSQNSKPGPPTVTWMCAFTHTYLIEGHWRFLGVGSQKLVNWNSVRGWWGMFQKPKYS